MDLSFTQMPATGITWKEVDLSTCIYIHNIRTIHIIIIEICTSYISTDFDEQCSKEDDWDVDTALYYDQGKIIIFSMCNGACE